jgi:hypothetical protein
LPQKKEWGIDPIENNTWVEFNEVKNQVVNSIDEKSALLCWHKNKDSYLAFFIVWW